MNQPIRLGKLISILQQVQLEFGDDLNVVLWDSMLYESAPDENNCDNPEGMYSVTNVEVREPNQTRSYIKRTRTNPVETVYIELSP